MFALRKPAPERIREVLATQAQLAFTYPEGATAATPPAGYVVDHTHVQLGAGAAVFQQAKEALQRWEQFQLGWVVPHDPTAPLQPGQTVGILAHVFGIWTLNVCRIVYTVEEPSRFGFAYGTLPEHAESGEERFTVEWNRQDDSVWYDILAFSRPHQLLARLSYPLVRRQQKRFARDSAAAMTRACRS